MVDPFAMDQYLARRQVFTLFKGKFHIYDTMENLVAYVEQKAFKLKEDITIFADEEKQRPLLRIQAQSIIDFSAAYHVTDLRNNELVGALRRKGFKSMVRDEWEILDATQQPLGVLREDSVWLATVRRILSMELVQLWIPQTFNVELNGRPAGTIKQHFNPFVLKLDVDLRDDPGRQFDRRLALAAVVLLLAIEGREG